MSDHDSISPIDKHDDLHADRQGQSGAGEEREVTSEADGDKEIAMGEDEGAEEAQVKPKIKRSMSADSSRPRDSRRDPHPSEVLVRSLHARSR